ncbi:hypothetical protein K0M31_015859 [Melipona bicolor]|uniref:Uncharacterized protein n=1 Tax=Melipona bicolor TaxID=60889 RepID=A0AA40KSX0_9HYME|nr:hypothetical protein K0M31_015859 [Melipona bicolor]
MLENGSLNVERSIGDKMPQPDDLITLDHASRSICAFGKVENWIGLGDQNLTDELKVLISETAAGLIRLITAGEVNV